MVSALEYFKDEVLEDKISPLFDSTEENIFGKKKRKKSIFSLTDTPKKSAIDYFYSDIYEIEEEDEDERTTLQYTKDILQDIVTQSAGGVVDAAESIANLALPKDQEIEISDVVPEAKTGFGKFVRPASQFLIPYTGVFKIWKGASLFIKNKKALDKFIKQPVKKGEVKKIFKDKGQTKRYIFKEGEEELFVYSGKLNTFKPTTKLTTKGELGIAIGAGAVADSFAFAPTDPNLADLFVQFPATKFTVMEWLQTDPNGDPGMERLKNALAGAVPTAFIPAITKGVAKGFNFIGKPIKRKVYSYADETLEREKLEKAQRISEKKPKTEKEIIELQDQVKARRTTTESIAIKFKEGNLIKRGIINFLDHVRGIKYLEDAAVKAGVKGLKGFGKSKEMGELTVYQDGRFLVAVGGMVEHFLLKQTFRFKDGAFVSTNNNGLQDLLIKNLGKDANVDDFFNYMGAKSLLSLKETDPKMFKNLLNTDEKVAFWTKKASDGDANSAYVNALDDMDRFNRELLQIAVDAEMISSKQMTNLLAKRRHYLPLYRDLSSDELFAAKAGGNKLRVALRGKVPIGTKEGELPLSNFFDNYIENVSGIISSSYKNHLKKNTFDIIDNAKKQGIDDLDDWAVKLTAKDLQGRQLKKITIKAPELKRQIKKQDTDLDLNDLDDLDDIALFRSERVSGLKDNEEFVFRTNKKGETIREIYKIKDALLYNTLRSVSPREFIASNAFVKFARWWKNLLTKAVTYDPGFFAGANFIRDTLSAAILSRNPFHLPFLSTVYRLNRQILSNKPVKFKDGSTMSYRELSKEFFLNGGSFASTLLRGETNHAALQTIYRKMGHSDYQNVFNTPKRYLDGYEKAVTGFENASRFTEYVLLRKMGQSARQAAFGAREVAVDFGMQGAWTFWRQYVSTVPFLNAGLQGLYRTARAIGKGSDQKAAVWTKMSAFVVTPTIGIYLLNKDNPNYWNQSQQIRDLNFMLPIGNDNWLKIPKPFEFGAISTIIESSLDDLYKRGDADSFFDTAWTVLKAQTRLSVVPQVISPLLNASFNRTYFGSPIIPEGMKHSIPDYGQSYPWSNRAITMAIENAPPWLRDRLMSPIKFENFFNAYTGTIGSYFLDLLDTSTELFTDVELKDWRLDEYPILKRFLTLDPAKYTEAEQSFYELKKKATQAIKMAKKFKDDFKFELYQEFLQDPENMELMRLYPRLEMWNRQIQDLNKQRNRIQNLPGISGEMKKVQIDEIERMVGQIFDKIMTDLENQNLQIFDPVFSLK